MDKKPSNISIRKTRSRVANKKLVASHIEVPTDAQIYDIGLRSLMKYASKLTNLNVESDVEAVDEVVNETN